MFYESQHTESFGNQTASFRVVIRRAFVGIAVRCWLFFNRDLSPGVPEAPEVVRFQEAARALDIELLVLKPSEFDLVVDAKHGWSAIYQGRELYKPDLIIPRCGSETSYFTLA